MLKLLACLAVLLVVAVTAVAEERSTGWQCPAGLCERNATNSSGNYFTEGGYSGHVGIDYMRNAGYPVYAIANGIIEDYGSAVPDYGSQCNTSGGAMLVKHIAKGHDGYLRTFYTVYGHAYKKQGLNIGDIVEKGEVIGNLHYYSGPGPTVCNKDWTHLHFGIRPDQKDTTAPFRGICSSGECGWTHPMNFLDANFPGSYDVDCAKVQNKYPNAFQQLGIPSCSSAAYVYPNQYIIWSYTYESMYGYWGMRTFWFEVDSNAQIIASDNDIPEGIGYGGGPGYAIFPTDSSSQGLPDFVLESLILKNLSNVETYSYYNHQSVILDSYSKNVGDADWATFPGKEEAEAIDVRAYLSKGYKEDPHSGEGKWKRVGIQEIQKGRLNVGNTKHESFEVDLSTIGPNGIPLPLGVYNFVVCNDRNKDDHNEDGEVPEKHKSNNCSTEAVFMVLDPEPLPPPAPLSAPANLRIN